MKLKSKIFVTALIFCVLTTYTTAHASWFYDLEGYSRLSLDSGYRVKIYASSSTVGEEVDFIQAYSTTYRDGSKVSTMVNSANDDHYISLYRYFYDRGYYTTSTKHNVIDWTGDEQTYTYANYNY